MSENNGNDGKKKKFSLDDLKKQIDMTIMETSSMINQSTKKNKEKDKNNNESDELKESAEKITKKKKSIFDADNENNHKVREFKKLEIINGIATKSLEQVIHESMIPYTEHVVLDRALPRVEDGLKPVQRRILYTMLELNLEPDKPFRKSARIVGDCMGKYHPHGDSSVYDAMVRMAQPFMMNVPLVHGHGNFGSVDGDSQAAMRYTEAKLTPLAMELLRDLEKNTVPWQLNFDDTLKEPVLLPGRFPNLLVNGASGIAVGVATNIPPHNLGEVINGVIAYIDNPNISLDEMMKIIPAPDFPTGGDIIIGPELKEAYKTGRGKIIIRAKIHMENQKDKPCLVITEMPYQTNKAQLLQKISQLQEEGKEPFTQIQEISDESDRHGMRAVIRLKKESDPKMVTEALFRATGLQVTFGINMVAIAEGKPQQMGLLDIIGKYTAFQREIVYNRTKFELKEAEDRAHIVEGLIIAISNIDEVIRIIKKSASVPDARERLMNRFKLSEIQAQAILDMKLSRLTNLEIQKLQEEFADLQKKIAKLRKIMDSKKLQFEIVRNEMQEIKSKFARLRLSKLSKDLEIKNIEANQNFSSAKEVYFGFTAEGGLKKIPEKGYQLAQRDLASGSEMCEIHTNMTATLSDKTYLVFTKMGNCLKVNLEEMPEFKWKDKGKFLKDFDNTLIGDMPVAMVEYAEGTKDNLIFITKDGLVKKSAFSEYEIKRTCFQGVKINEGDCLLDVMVENKEINVMFVSNVGLGVRIVTDDIPLQGRISAGVRGIFLEKGEFAAWGGFVKESGTSVALITNEGYGKRISSGDFEIMTRGRKGVKAVKFVNENTGRVICGFKVNPVYTLAVQDEATKKFSRKEFVSMPNEQRLAKGKQILKNKFSNIFSYFK